MLNSGLPSLGLALSLQPLVFAAFPSQVGAVQLLSLGAQLLNVGTNSSKNHPPSQKKPRPHVVVVDVVVCAPVISCRAPAVPVVVVVFLGGMLGAAACAQVSARPPPPSWPRRCAETANPPDRITPTFLWDLSSSNPCQGSPTVSAALPNTPAAPRAMPSRAARPGRTAHAVPSADKSAGAWTWEPELPKLPRVIGVAGADTTMQERVAGWLGRPRWLFNATRALGPETVVKNGHNVTEDYAAPHWRQYPWVDGQKLSAEFGLVVEHAALVKHLAITQSATLVVVHACTALSLAWILGRFPHGSLSRSRSFSRSRALYLSVSLCISPCISLYLCISLSPCPLISPVARCVKIYLVPMHQGAAER